MKIIKRLFVASLAAMAVFLIWNRNAGHRQRDTYHPVATQIRSPSTLSAIAKDKAAAPGSALSAMKDMLKPRDISKDIDSKSMGGKSRDHIASTSKACLEFMADVQSLNLEALHNRQQAFRLPSRGGCAKPPESLMAYIADYEASCGEYEKALQKEGNQDLSSLSEQCLYGLFFLRGGISSWLTQDQPVNQITDSRLLMDRLASAFGSVRRSGQAPNHKDLIAVGDRLMAVDPHSYAGAKAALIGRVLESFEDKTAWHDASRVGALENLAQRVSSMKPDDEGNAVLQEILETRGFDPALTRNYAERRLRANPNDAAAHYDMAWALYKMGEPREQVIAALEQATRLAPDNEEYRSTLQRQRAATEAGATGAADSSGGFGRTVTLGMTIESLW
jgi:tetratricopeptide (TPR) repeat protein